MWCKFINKWSNRNQGENDEEKDHGNENEEKDDKTSTDPPRIYIVTLNKSQEKVFDKEKNYNEEKNDGNRNDIKMIKLQQAHQEVMKQL